MPQANWNIELLLNIDNLQALRFLKYVFTCVSENDEDSNEKAEVVQLEILEWLKILVNNVNIFADDAVKYFVKLQTEQFSVEFNKKYTSVTTELVSQII